MTEEIEGTRFNTGISAMMEFINAAYKVLFIEQMKLDLFFDLFLFSYIQADPYSDFGTHRINNMNTFLFLMFLIRIFLRNSTSLAFNYLVMLWG